LLKIKISHYTLLDLQPNKMTKTQHIIILFILFTNFVTISFASDLRSPVRVKFVYKDISLPSSQEIESKFHVRSPELILGKSFHTNNLTSRVSREEIKIKLSTQLSGSSIRRIRRTLDQNISKNIIVSKIQNRIIYPTPNVAKHFIFSFLKPKQLEKVYNYLHSLDSTFPFQKMFSGEKLFKCHTLIQPTQESKILYHFLGTNDHILFCEKTKIASALDKNFHGSNESILTIIYEDIGPFNSSFEINNHESAHLAISSKNKFILLLKNNLRTHQFSILCSGQKCVHAARSRYFYSIILFDENSEIQFPEDISYILKAKHFKFQKLFQIFCFNGKLILQYQKFCYQPIQKVEYFLESMCFPCLSKTFFEIFLFIFGYPIIFVNALPFYVQSFPILYTYFLLSGPNEDFLNFNPLNFNFINFQPVVPIFATFYYLFYELTYPFEPLPPKKELKMVAMILFFKRWEHDGLCFKTFLIFIMSYVSMLFFHLSTYFFSLALSQKSVSK